MKRALTKTSRNPGGKEKGSADTAVHGETTRLSRERTSARSPTPSPLRRLLTKSLASSPSPDTQSTEASSPQPWTPTDRHRSSREPLWSRSSLQFLATGASTSPSKHSSPPRGSMMPESTPQRARRRMSYSLSPSSLRAATRAMMGHGETVNTNYESLPDASTAPGSTTAGGTPEGGAHAGAGAEFGGGGIKRLGRRRTMSIGFGNISGIRRSASQKNCTGALEFPDGTPPVGSPESPGRAGLGERLRRKAIDSLKSRPVSQMTATGLSSSELADDFKVLKVAESSMKLPSLLDLVPDEKRADVIKLINNRKSEYVTLEGIDVYCGTWNVNAKKPKTTDPWWLYEWLRPKDDEHGAVAESAESAPGSKSRDVQDEEEGSKESKRTSADGMADIYAIGLQEVVDLNAVNVAMDKNSQRMSSVWEECVASTLNRLSHRAKKKRATQFASYPPPEKDQSADNYDEGVPSNRDGLPCEANNNRQDEINWDSSDDEGDQPLNSSKWNATTGSISRGIDPLQETSCQQTRWSRSVVMAGVGEVSCGSGESCLSEPSFVLVAKEHLVGTWLAVFVRAAMLPAITDVRTGSVTAGMLGLMGNKGGVGVRFRVHDSSVCFVSSHLAAHRENVRARNDNFVKIFKGMVFPSPAMRSKQHRQQQPHQPQPQRKPASPRRHQSSPFSSNTFRRQTIGSEAASPESRSSWSSLPRSPSSPGSPVTPGSPATPCSLRLEVAGGQHRSSWDPVPSPTCSSEPSRRSPIRAEPIRSEMAHTISLPPPVPLRVTGASSRGTADQTTGGTDGVETETGIISSFVTSASEAAVSNAHTRKPPAVGLVQSEGASPQDASFTDKERVVPPKIPPEGGGHQREKQHLQGGLLPTELLTTAREVPLGNDSGDDDSLCGCGDVFLDGIAVDAPSTLECGELGEGEASAAAAGMATVGGGAVAGAKPTQLLKPPEIDSQDAAGLTLQDHDFVFWLGDLNYRIDVSVPASDVLERASTDRLEFLRDMDQLNCARAAGEAFVDFQEGELNFPPTYKYAPGTDEYDVRPDKKFRAPAWCDRVLFWTGGDCGGAGGGVTQLDYRRSERPLTSDHKPVSATFRLACQVIDSDLYMKVVLELVDDAVMSAEDTQAKVDVVGGGQTMNFGVVRYKAQQCRSIWLENSGRIPANFSVPSNPNRLPSSSPPPIASPRNPLPAEDETAALRARQGAHTGQPGTASEFSMPASETGVSPSGNKGGKGARLAEGATEGAVAPAWYVVDPGEGTLEPGQKLEIEVRVLVEDSLARALADGRVSKTLEDIVVIRVERGNDRYLSLSGTYGPSVYGSSLEAMLQQQPHASGGEQEDERVPRQISRLMEALLESEDHCRQPDLFVQEGLEEEVDAIREAVDTGSPLAPCSAHSVVEALVTLLASLSPAVIPAQLCSPGEEGRNQHVGASCRILLNNLPGPSRATIVCVLRCFRSLLEHKNQNGLTPGRLLPVLRACFLPDALKPAMDTSEGVASYLPQHSKDEGRVSEPGATSRGSKGGGDSGDDGGGHGVDDDRRGVGVAGGGSCDAMDLMLHHLLVNEPL